VLKRPLENVSATRSRKEPRIPVVLSKEEVKGVLTLLDGTAGLIVKTLYAGGLRISEAIRLRIQDVDFSFKQITVRDAKGKKDRVAPLANDLAPLLQTQIEKVKLMHEKDLAGGYGCVHLPYALSKKYPNAEIRRLLGSMCSPVEILLWICVQVRKGAIILMRLLSIRRLSELLVSAVL